MILPHGVRELARDVRELVHVPAQRIDFVHIGEERFFSNHNKYRNACSAPKGVANVFRIACRRLVRQSTTRSRVIV